MADSTINGLTALIGSDVDQTADQFAVWDNSAATTKKITRTNVMNGPLVGDVGSAVRAAADSYGGVSFDGATSGTRITSSLTGQQIGTGDFTVWVRFRCPASIPASGNGSLPGIWALSDSATATYRANAILLYLDSSSQLRLLRYGANQATDNRIATITNFVTTWAGQVVDVVATRAGNVVKLYVNGTDTSLVEVSAGTAPAWGASVVSDFFNVGMQSAANIFGDRIYRAVLFNRALSASDVAELSVSGVNPADQWGTQTAAYSSNFSAGTNSWTAVNGTAAGNIDAIGGQDDNLRFTQGTGAMTYSGVYRGGFAGKKRHRITASYFIPSGQSQIVAVKSEFIGPPPSASDSQTVTNAWTTFSHEGIVSAADGFVRIYSTFTGPTGNGTDVFYLRAITVERIGAIVDLDLSSGIGYQAHDRSTNLLHGTLFGGVSWTSPKKSGTVYGTTSTNGNQQLLASASIPADATITSIAVNSNGGTPNVTIGNASGGTQLLASTALTGVSRQILTPTLPISTTGNLWVNSTSTATLNWTINYTTSF